jgi:hypothetical protein
MALKIGKAGAMEKIDDSLATGSGGGGNYNNNSAHSGGEINYPLEDYREMHPLLASISQVRLT